MRQTLALPAAAMWIAIVSGNAYGQDTPPPTVVHGSVDVGYRWTDVEGSNDTYRRLFDLSEGARLLNAELHGNTPPGGNSFADSFSLHAVSIGGDPYPSFNATAKRAGAYDLRIDWRKSRWFDGAPITPASIDGFDTRAVTDAHSWSTERQFGTIALTLEASERLHFLFNFDRGERRGGIGSTRAIDFVGAPSAWGAFARANPYPTRGQIHDTTNRVTGGVSYGGDQWTVHYRGGYQVQDESLVQQPTTTPERSINVGDPATADEALQALTWSQTRHLTAPLSDVAFNLRPSSRLEWRGEYLFAKYSGPADLSAGAQGAARTNATGTTISPYQVLIDGHTETDAPSHVLGQGMTYRLANGWAVDADYRYSLFSSEAQGQLGSSLGLYTAATANPQVSSEEVNETWRQSVHAFTAAVTFVPSAVLTIRPGIRLSQRDIEARVDEVLDAARSLTEQTIGPDLSIGYRPTAWLAARGTYRSGYSDASYTRMSPIQRTVANLTLHAEPAAGFTVEAAATLADADLYSTSFVSHTRTASLQLGYTLSERLTTFGGLDYQTYLGTGDTTFLRGTAPITDIAMEDSEIDRIWQAGATLRATENLDITASGSFVRTTGTDSITGEPPLYGPTSFPLATVSASYNIPRAGQISIDWQRTYMLQDLLPANNFSANLFTVRYGRRF
ncbi:MAG TPA: hypothetical protein VJP86_12015 [Vicinamibacterales bacterium]|nr:hypothetical protein [Vicinamibacterales bacterium]